MIFSGSILYISMFTRAVLNAHPFNRRKRIGLDLLTRNSINLLKNSVDVPRTTSGTTARLSRVAYLAGFANQISHQPASNEAILINEGSTSRSRPIPTDLEEVEDLSET